MRVISLFAFILVSTTLLSESHHAGAIGVDSSSHGLVYGGRVVRRYGALYRRLQERAGDPKGQDAVGIPKAKPSTPENNKIPNKFPDNNNNKTPDKTPGNNNNKTPENKAPPDNENKVPANKPTAPPAPPAPPVPPAPPTNKLPAPSASPIPSTVPAVKAPVPPTTPPKANVSKKELGPSKDDTTDTTLDSTSDQNADSDTAQAGTPTVATGSMSSAAISGLASVGGVFVLVGGLFAFSQRKKNKEMTKSIVSNSAKAWEQQSSTYEVLEEETKPLGTFAVVATYTPTLSDELDIQPGDKVTILVEYDDGWVQGINETRGGIKGVFPRHCVDMSQPTNKTNKSNKRSSSMGGGYTEVDLS